MAVVAIMIVRLAASPAEGDIKTASSAKTNLPKTVTIKTYDGKYFRFVYPSTFSTVGSQQSVNLETLTLIGSDHSSKTLAITVTSEELSSDSGVNLRRQNKGSYIETPLDMAGQTGIMFTAQKSFEKVAFITHEKFVLSFALSDPNGNNYAQEYDKMLASLNWK